MNLHAPSFLLGVGVTTAVVATRTRLRPVAVELGALGVHLGRLGRSLVERQREEFEDLWAEVEERVRERVREERRRAHLRQQRPGPRPRPRGHSVRGAETVTIGQALPRRVRLVAPPLAWHRDACERVGRALAAEGSLARVEIDPATGSVIVEGEDPPLAASALAARLAELLRDERDEQGRPLDVRRPEERPGPTRIARAVVTAVAGINADVRAALDQRADLGTLLPVAFALAGLFEVGATGRMPVPTWFNLLWWSLRSFMSFNIRAVEEEVQEGPGAPEVELDEIRQRPVTRREACPPALDFESPMEGRSRHPR